MKSRKMKCFTLVALFAALAITLQPSAQDKADRNHHHSRYKFIELGTLGGPSSYFIFGTGINSSGTVTGLADTSVSDPFYPNCFIDCFVVHTFTWKNGVLADLGALPPGYSSGPNGINESGLIAGLSQNGAVDPVAGPEFDAVVWKNGHIMNLGTFGGTFSYANALNDRGQVVGFALNGLADSFSLGDFCNVGAPMPTQMRAFLWRDGEMRNLGTLGGLDSCALNVNQRGQASGHSFTNTVPNPSTGLPTIHPFLWDGSRMLDLGSLGGTIGLANSINDPGQVVGVMNLAGDLISHPFLWTRGSLTDLGTLGGNNGQAAWINNEGDVVGYADLPGSAAHHGFFWSGGRMQDVGTVGNQPCSSTLYVNSSGQAVGRASDCMGGSLRAFLWEKGRIVDLNAFVPSDSGLTLTEAVLISDSGEIAAQGAFANGDERAVLLIPDGDCDEDCEGSIAASQYNAADAGQVTQNSSATAHDNKSRAPIERLRSQARHPYQLPGPRPLPMN